MPGIMPFCKVKNWCCAVIFYEGGSGHATPETVKLKLLIRRVEVDKILFQVFG
jgi:hypothetical protein